MLPATVRQMTRVFTILCLNGAFITLRRTGAAQCADLPAFYKEDLDYTLANLNKLVVKDVAEAGGYGVVFGRELTQEKLAELAGMIKREPRRFIAQEVIDFKDLPVMENGVQAERKADLRAFVLTGAETKVWPSGLTRFSREPDSFVVNSSQGGALRIHGTIGLSRTNRLFWLGRYLERFIQL